MKILRTFLDNYDFMAQKKIVLKYFSFFFLFLFSCLGFFRCNAPQPWPDDPTNSKSTKVRFLNFIFDQKTIDIYVDNIIIVSALKPFYSSKVLSSNIGYRTVKITETGKTDEIFKGNILIDSAKSNIISFFYKSPSVQYVKDFEKSGTTTQNKTSLKFFNLADEVPSLDVLLKINNGEYAVTNIQVRGSSVYTEFPVGNSVLIFKNNLNNSIALSSSFITSANKSYSMFFLGKMAITDSGFNALQILDESNKEEQKLVNPSLGLTRMRILNNYSLTNSIEIWVDSLKILGQLDYNVISDFNFMTPGNRRIRAVNSYGQIFKDTLINLLENKKYTLVLSKINNYSTSMLYEVKEPTPVSFKSYVKICNLSPSFDKIDIKLKSPSSSEQTISNINYSQFSDYVPINSDTNLITLIYNNQNFIVSKFKPTEKSYYSIFILGSVSDTGKSNLNFYYSEDSDTSIQNLYKLSPIKSSIRYINCISNIPSLNFLTDGMYSYANATYKYSSGLLSIPFGTRSFKLLDNSLNILKETAYNISSERNYLYLAGKKLNDFSPFLVESFEKAPNASKSVLRIINALQEDIPVTISIRNSSDAISIDNLQYSSFSDYFDLASGNNEVTVKNSLTDEVILSNTISFNNSTVYSIIVLGSSTDPNDMYSLNILNESNQNIQKLQTIALPNSKIRFINGSIDSPTLDLLVNNTTEIKAINFKSGSAVAEFPGGSRNIKVKNSINQTVVYDTNQTFYPARNYVAIAANKFSNLEVSFIETPSKTPPTIGNSIRLVNCAYELGPLDILISNVVGKQSSTNILYKSATDYFDVTVQQNEIIVTSTGSGKIIATALATFSPDKVYSGYIIGATDNAGKQDYSIYFMDDKNSMEQVLFTFNKINFSQLRVINASPNSSTFDITVDGQSWLTGLGYAQSSGYNFIKNSLRNIKIYKNGSAVASSDFVYNFLNDKLNTLFITDSLVKVSPLVIEDINISHLPGQAFVRFINLSPNTVPLDVKIGSGIGIIKHSSLTFKQVTNYLNYDAATMSFVITESGKTTEVASLKGFTLSPNKYYTFVVFGFRNGPSGQSIELKWFPDN